MIKHERERTEIYIGWKDMQRHGLAILFVYMGTQHGVLGVRTKEVCNRSQGSDVCTNIS